MTKKRIRPKTVSRQATRMATVPEVRALRHQLRANRDRITAQSDRITAQSDRITAQKDRITAQSDEITAQSDQITAQSDQITAQSDQITAQNDRLQQSQTDLDDALFRYADLYDLAPIGYLSLNGRGVICQANLAAAALLERERPDVIGLPLLRVIAAGDRNAFRHFLTDARSAVGTSSIEVMLATSGSHIVRVVARLVPARPSSHELVAAIFDVTEERRLESKSAAALEREQQRSEELAREVAIRTRTEDRVKSLLERLVSVQEEERRRIARNLHDHLGQQLTALRLSIGALKDHALSQTQLRARLEAIDKIAAQIDRDVDYLAWDLRPAALDDVGLTAALETAVRDWAATSGVHAEFHTTPAAARLAAESESHLYRIVQEALNNVSKHAAATHVSVLLEHTDGEVRLIVEDNGRGFDADQALHHRAIGLTGMQERAALIGGQVEFESAPGKGTTVFTRVPIRATSVSRR